MGYEGSCRRFEELCREIGTAAANRMLDDDPFAGCLYDPEYDSDGNEEYLMGMRRPTSDEEDEYMEMDAMNE